MPVQELGVDEAFDYTQEKLSEKFASQPFDIIVDVIGGKSPLRLLSMWVWYLPVVAIQILLKSR